MTITVNNVLNPIFDITPSDMLDGHAYIDREGTLYICNQIHFGTRKLAVVSVCGKYVVYTDNPDSNYREVNIEINILKD